MLGYHRQIENTSVIGYKWERSIILQIWASESYEILGKHEYELQIQPFVKQMIELLLDCLTNKLSLS